MLQLAEERRAELVVTGRRGASKAASTPLGSVSAGVVHGVYVPAMVARDRAPAPICRVLVGLVWLGAWLAAAAFRRPRWGCTKRAR